MDGNVVADGIEIGGKTRACGGRSKRSKRLELSEDVCIGRISIAHSKGANLIDVILGDPRGVRRVVGESVGD